MKYKVICILLLMPIVLALTIFISTTNIKLPVETVVDRIVLEHDNVEPFMIYSDESSANKELYRIHAYSIPNTELTYTISDESKATIINEDGKYYINPIEEGTVTIYITDYSKTVMASFDAYLYKEGTQDILVTDSAIENNSLDDTYYYGRYDLNDNGEKVDAQFQLNFLVLGINDQRVAVDIISGNASLNNNTLTILEPDANNEIVLDVKSYDNPSVNRRHTLNIVKDGINVYNYEQLLQCTNRSTEGEVVVLRSNFESRTNTFIDPNHLTSAQYKNTALFGFPNTQTNTISHETTKITSTYDTTYIDNYNAISTNTQKLNKELIVGLKIQKDFYGNGYTLNMHELTYPSGSPVNGIPQLSNTDLYRGPLPFVQASGMATVFGQDNIGTLVYGDGIDISNLNLKSCNNISDLTELNNVGTTLEVIGDDVTLKDMIISNGRTVVRSYSNKNLLIDHCLLQYAREFILKAGSNTTIKPNKGALLSQMSDEQKEDFLAPELNKDSEGRYESDSSLTVNDTFFYNSGLFSIGLDTHFAGELLYDASQTSYGTYFPEVNNLAGTSLATYMNITGDTRFYDWKRLTDLDSSTLITVLNGDPEFVNRYFNLQGMVDEYITHIDSSFAIIEEEDNVKTKYIHGGIAFYGGGKNFSSVTINDEIIDEFKYIPNVYISGIISQASGTAPFKFYLYTNASTPSYFKKMPSIEELRAI